MRLELCFSFLLLICSQGVLAGQTLLPSEIEPAAFAQLLRDNKQNNRQTFAAQLLAAERAFANGNLANALEYYDKAATLGAPNSRWYLGKSALYTQLGKDAEALQIIKDGKEMYPFSNRLALAFARMTLLKDGTPTYEEVEEMDLPAVAKVQLKALVAFRNRDLVRGLLETERAHYLAPEELLDKQLAQQYLQTSFAFAEAFRPEECSDSRPSCISYESGSIEYLYKRSIASAIRAYYIHHQDEQTEGSILVILADMRTAILRDFVKKGHLGRFQDPMLVDLYILDNASHLKGATLGMYLNTIGQLDSGTEKEMYPYMQEIAAANKYMDTQWGKDVDAFLARF